MMSKGIALGCMWLSFGAVSGFSNIELSSTAFGLSFVLGGLFTAICVSGD